MSETTAPAEIQAPPDTTDYQVYKAERLAAATVPAPVTPPATAEPVPAPVEPPKDAPKEPEPTPEDKQKAASEAAKVLAAQSAESRREKRQREIQAEIDAATRKKYDLLREVQELEQRKAAGVTPAPATAPAVPADQSDPEPKLDDAQFADWDQWNAAHVRWLSRQEARTLLKAEREATAKAETEQRAKAAQDAEAKRRSEALAANAKRVEAFVVQHPDYEAVLKQATGEVSEEITAGLIESESGPAMAYYLGQHPEEFSKIATLTGKAAERALGRLEALVEAQAPSVEAKPAEPAHVAEPPKSSAPAPITPVRGAAIPPTAPESDYQAYKRERLAQMKAKGVRL